MILQGAARLAAGEALGCIVRVPDEQSAEVFTPTYIVQVSGGREVTATAEEVQPLLCDNADSNTVSSLESCIVLRTVIGSRAYGLGRADSDFDRRGVYVAPPAMHWSLTGSPDQLEDPHTKDCYWEVGKCILLALKSNPAVLEALYSPIVEHADWTGTFLLEERGALVSRLAANTYGRYAVAQFKKLQSDERNYGKVKWKHAMHLIRLLHAGIRLLRSGTLTLPADEHRDQLLAIRDGQLPLERVLALHDTLQAALTDSVYNSPLPPMPDYRRANLLLLTIRTRAAREAGLL